MKESNFHEVQQVRSRILFERSQVTHFQTFDKYEKQNEEIVITFEWLKSNNLIEDFALLFKTEIKEGFKKTISKDLAENLGFFEPI